MPRPLKNVTFVYVQREDRILIVVNAGQPEAWSCWLTRRLALALLERAADYIAGSSNLAQRAPADLRGDMIAFERDAAIANTAPAMSKTPAAVLASTAAAAELAERLTITPYGDDYRLEIRGLKDDGAGGMLKRAELQRMLQMLHIEVGKAGWPAAPVKPQAAPASAAPATNPARH